jgi:eukaryotic-like serine/threonine-protein kinase
MPFVAIGTNLAGPDAESYTITDFLGRGSFGEVYRAAGTNSGNVVAVKMLPLSDLATDDARIALLNEIRTAQQVVHPNIVRVLYVNDEAKSAIGPYVFMEYISGGTLLKLIRTQASTCTPIPLARAVEMMIEIAQGARAINQKVIHRDIKPDNILVEGKTLKIGDFGISKFIDESTRLRTFKGGQHVAYMAPEAWQNQTNTIGLDVYSVGLVFHQILTLKHPLLDKVRDPNNFLDWQNAHLYEQCPDARTLRNEVPSAIALLANRMVSKRPHDRPSWEEVLGILSQPEVVDPSDHPSVRQAVEAIAARKQREQAEAAKQTEQQDARARQLNLYSYSCDTLLQQLDPVVQQFNRQSQHGKITCYRDMFVTYNIPSGHNITISFFEPKMSGIRIRGSEVIGGVGSEFLRAGVQISFC